MTPLVRTARDVSIGIVSFWAVRTLIPLIRDRMTSHDEKETPMGPVYDAESLDLSHLYPVRIRYAPKNLQAEAIQATEYTIGKLALEFETEIFYSGDRPYFHFDAKRFDATQPDGQTPPQSLCVRLSDWIVPLRGELHVFPDHLLRNSFDVEDVVSPGVPTNLFIEGAHASSIAT